MAQPRTQKPRLAVGLISGTSLDGIDAALVRISGRGNRIQTELLAFKTYPYPADLRARLLRLAAGEPVTSGEVSELNFRVGERFAAAALRLCRAERVNPSSLACIGSHGQTVFHQGRAVRTGKGKSLASTLQIGEPSLIAARCGVTTVADFRPADMARGGEGAPLVPLVDYLLFSHPQKGPRSGQGTVALNLGGIANFTVIPAEAEQEGVFGFDTGPANMVIDALVRRETRGKKSFDRGGQIGARGQVIPKLLKQALAHPFLRRRPPKSAGREQFGTEFVERCFPKNSGHRFEDLVATATELTAVTVTDAIQRFVLRRTAIDRLIVSGGGAHNRFLMKRFGELLPGVRVRRSREFGIPENAKEAVTFALLADRTLAGLPGNLPAVTGARRPAILGKVVYAAPR